jgi:hypothetical protein
MSNETKIMTMPAISDLLKEICTGKVKAKDNFEKCCLTDANNGAWNDAIKEARGSGVSIKSFCDTQDKVVLHPGHLGYDFDYYWGRSYWSREDCWDINVNNIKREEANNKLWILMKELTQLQYEVWVVFPSGCDKGYLSTYLFDGEEHKRFNSLDELLHELPQPQLDEMVLFVFGLDPELYAQKA